MAQATLSPSSRSTIRRGKDRARTDRAELHEVLDAALICHLGVLVDGAPRVLPTGYGRLGDTLYLHGSTGARSLREAADGEVCVSVTLVDGVVYARSAFHFSVNYRSAVIHGRPRPVTDADEKWEALRVLTEHLAPGSWDHVRQPSRRDLAATSVLALDLGEAAVKIRSGSPRDEPEDVAAAAAWAGVLPLRRSWGEPEPSDDLPDTVETPVHVTNRKQP
ncbi:pyridoxamine 5'-phosphate oxidase family protein [Saccharopolyspora taberi]|uniref:Pyridoxamine 5'-phosphate oxidase family protein n=1 Tax=Saccharopolyspora taberi TaxID=60895 RepID=A0ABN3V5K7_9PSEU